MLLGKILLAACVCLILTVNTASAFSVKAPEVMCNELLFANILLYCSPSVSRTAWG